MKNLITLLAAIGLFSLIGCTGKPTTPQEAAADERAMAYDNQQEQDQMDIDEGYTNPTVDEAEINENPNLAEPTLE